MRPTPSLLPSVWRQQMPGPDDSGRFTLTKTMSDLDPKSAKLATDDKADLLIEAIRGLASANLRLYDENRTLKRLMMLGVLVGVVVVSIQSMTLWKQWELSNEASTSTAIQRENVAKIREVIGAVSSAKADFREVAEEVKGIPRVRVRPSDDPTAEPEAVLEVPPASNGTVEIPLGKPRKQKKEKP